MALPLGPASAHDRRGEKRYGGATRSSSAHNCDRDSRTCQFVFSRRTTARLSEKLASLVADHPQYVEKMASRACGRAEKKGECEDNWVAGLLNGVDALEFAVGESSCGTLKLAWSKTFGLSQEWGYTNGPTCTD